MSYPTLTIGPTNAGAIGTAATQVFSYTVRATSIITTTYSDTALTITVSHECSTATLTANVAGNTVSYTMNNPTPQVTTLNSFTPANIPTGATCFTYSLMFAPANTVPVTIPSYITFAYPTFTIGPTGLGVLGT